MDKLRALQYFIVAAEQGSFAAARVELASTFRARGLSVGKRITQRFGGAKAKRDVEATAQVFIGLFEYCINLGMLYPSPVTRERAIRVAMDMITAYFEQ